MLSTTRGSGTDRDVALSPEGTRLAVQRFEGSPVLSDIWLKDLTTGAESRFTAGGTTHYTPVWSRNDALFFVARRGDGYGVYQAAVFERREPTLLASFANFVALNDVSPDGRSLLLQQLDWSGHFDLMKLVFGQTSGPAPFLRTRFNEEQAQLSPDGRWVAHVSDESGRPDVHICASDRAEAAHVQVSADGGVQPRWRGDGRELFFVGLDGRLMTVRIGRGTPPRVSAPVALFQTHVNTRTSDTRHYFEYAVSSDGQRFPMPARAETEIATPWTVVVNWTAALK